MTFVNATAASLTGWAEAEAQGRPLHEVFNIINETTRQPVDNPATLVMELGHVVGLANHTVLIAKDGTERPIADSAAPIRDPQGAMLGVVLVFRDVSEERRAQAALEEQRAWLETTLESITDAFCGLDHEWRFTYVNRQAEVLLGRDRDSLIGKVTGRSTRKHLVLNSNAPTAARWRITLRLHWSTFRTTRPMVRVKCLSVARGPRRLFSRRQRAEKN